MNQKSKRFSQIDLPYIEDTKSKLEKIDLIRNTTNATIIQSDLLRKTNKKLKTLIQPKSVYPIKKQRILQPLRRQHNSIPIDKFVLNKTLQVNICCRSKLLSSFFFSFIQLFPIIIFLKF